MSWTSRAACRSVDPKIFYMENKSQHKLALGICSACPVKQDCWNDASWEDRFNTIRGGVIPKPPQGLFNSETPIEEQSCKRGHVGSWTVNNPTRGTVRCLECKRIQDREYRDRKKLGHKKDFTPRPDDTCPKGHVGHYKMYAGNKKRCKECVREWNASRYAATMNA